MYSYETMSDHYNFGDIDLVTMVTIINADVDIDFSIEIICAILQFIRDRRSAILQFIRDRRSAILQFIRDRRSAILQFVREKWHFTVYKG